MSTLVFNWISPMMALGAARPLQDTDLWKMDEARSAAPLSRKLAENYARRRKRADDYNALLADPNTPLPWPQNWFYPLLPHREKRERDYRTKYGKKSPSLAWSVSDTFGSYFWLGGLFKIIGDTSAATSPLVMRQIIAWSTKWQAAKASGGALPYPHVGHGVGLAIALFIMLVISSLSIHNFFVRSMGVGVLGRGALISAIYNRALRLTQKSRGEIPNGKLVNHISMSSHDPLFSAHKQVPMCLVSTLRPVSST